MSSSSAQSTSDEDENTIDNDDVVGIYGDHVDDQTGVYVGLDYEPTGPSNDANDYPESSPSNDDGS